MQIGSQYQREDLLNTAEFNMCEEVIATVFKAQGVFLNLDKNQGVFLNLDQLTLLDSYQLDND